MTQSTATAARNLSQAISNLIDLVDQCCQCDMRFSDEQFAVFQKLDGRVEAIRKHLGLDYPSVDGSASAFHVVHLGTSSFGYSCLLLSPGLRISREANRKWFIRLQSLKALADAALVENEKKTRKRGGQPKYDPKNDDRIDECLTKHGRDFAACAKEKGIPVIEVKRAMARIRDRKRRKQKRSECPSIE